MGPPGSEIKQKVLTMSRNLDAVVVSMGDLLLKEVVKKSSIGQEIEEYIRNFQYVPDSIVVQVLLNYINGLKSDKDIIVEGFPKTIYQAKFLVSHNIIPDSLVFINLEEDSIRSNLREKFKKMERDFGSEEEDLEERTTNYLQTYFFHLKQCRETYKEIFLEYEYKSSTFIEELSSLIRYKKHSGYQSTLKFLMSGTNCGAKEEFIEKFRACYGIKVIRMESVLSSEIKKNNNISQEILHFIETKKRFPTQLLFDLVIQAINKMDVQINGFLLDLTGFGEDMFRLFSEKATEFNFVIQFDDGFEPLESEEHRLEHLFLEKGKGSELCTGKEFGVLKERAQRFIKID